MSFDADLPDDGGDFELAPDSRRTLRRALRAHQRHELKLAETLYGNLLQQHPGHPLLLHQMGLLLHETGRADEARRSLAAAERAAPDHGGFLLNQARVLIRQGQPSEAIPRLRRLYARFTESAEIVRELATALTESGDWPNASELLGEWLSFRTNDHATRLLLGDLSLRVGEFPEALDAWRLVRDAAPPDLATLARHRIGDLQLRLSDGRGARATFDGAAGLAPGAAWVHCGLAAAAGVLGDFVAMRREAEAAIAADELSFTGWYQLTTMPEACTEEAEAGLRKAIARTGENPNFWLLHLALGRVLDRLERWDEAFATFTRAHALKGRLPNHQYRNYRAELARIRACIDIGFMERVAGFPPARVRPIFVVGMPRSGTTLVEAILGTHPAVAAGGEMRLVDDWLIRHGGAAAAADPAGWIGALDKAGLATIHQAWQRSLRVVPEVGACVTDKLPENFLFLGALAAAFPNAGIVHIRRDPLDTCVSCFMTALAGHRAASLPTLADLGGYYRGYIELMEFWRAMVPENRIAEIYYESLVREPETGVRQLLAALDLDWHPACLRFHESPRGVSTASAYQVRRPINANSLGQWRRYSGHLEPLRAALAPDTNEVTTRR